MTQLKTEEMIWTHILPKKTYIEQISILKRCSISLVITEMSFKTTIKSYCHLKLQPIILANNNNDNNLI